MTTFKTVHLAIFASGGGSNAKNIINYFAAHPQIHIKLLCTNNPNSGVLAFGPENQIPVEIFAGKQYLDGEYLETLLSKYKIDLIILAGYLKKIPDAIIRLYPNKILNIHPALLPNFGGKGMYGMNVHRAVIESGKRESGMTIHYVNEEYDKGEIIFQDRVHILPEMDAEALRNAVLKLEHKHFPSVIEKVCQGIHS